MTHDARILVGLLRDHLAAHDRSLSFLFGAGTSSSVNAAPLDASGNPIGYKPLIPAVAGLTDACKSAVDALGLKQAGAWTKLCAECTEFGFAVNIETVLGRIRSKLDAIAAADFLDGLSRSEWLALDEAVRATIAALAAPASASIPDKLPHHDFARWVKHASRRQAVELFTTNYDVLFELSFDRLRVPHFDGFIGSQNAYFSPDIIEAENLLPSPSWIRFWKLHGSVSWTKESVAGEERVTRGKPSGSGEMILPSHRKYDESRKQPYRALMDRLGKVVSRSESLLVTSGFSFGDQHINAMVLDALDQHPHSHVVVLSFDSVSHTHHVARWAAERQNILLVGPNAGVIAGRYGEWTVSGTPDKQLVEATAGAVVPDAALAGGVRVTVGDFNAFSAFLSGMLPRHGVAP